MSIKRIKLFVDAHAIDIEFTGTYTFVQNLYNTFLNNYPQVDVYFGTINPEHLQSVFPQVPAERILAYSPKRQSFLRYFIDIPRFIKQYEFDIAHFQYFAPVSNSSCRYMVTLHDALYYDFKRDHGFISRKKKHSFFGYGFKRANIKTTVSNYSRERLAAVYKVPENQIHVLPNAIVPIPPVTDSKKAQAAQHIKDKYGIQNFIFYVSRIERRKNQELLLKTFLDLKLYEQQISVVFIGKGTGRVPAFRSLLDNLTPQQRPYVHCLTQVDPDDLSDFYRSCRVFAFPSKGEGFGIPPLEAAINLAPVICSSVTAMQDFDFFKPYFFDPANGPDFAEKLRLILNNPPSPEFLNKVAQTIVQKYSWEKTAAKLYELVSGE